MNIESRDLDAWERTCVAVNGALVKVKDALQPGIRLRGTREDLLSAVDAAQSANWDTRKQLLEVGALDSIHEKAEASRAAAGLPPMPSPSLTEMGSPANHRLLAALREAHAAAQQVQRERRGDDSLVDALGDYIEGVETEIFGPACMRGLEA